MIAVPPAIKYRISRDRRIQQCFVRECLHISVLPTVRGVLVEDLNAGDDLFACLRVIHKGKTVIGVSDRDIIRDHRANQIIGDSAYQVEDGAGKIGMDPVPLISAVKTFVSAYRFIQSQSTFILFSVFVRFPRRGKLCFHNAPFYVRNLQIQQADKCVCGILPCRSAQAARVGIVLPQRAAHTVRATNAHSQTKG